MWCFSPHVWCSTTWRCRSCNGMLLCPSWVPPSNSSKDFLIISEKEGSNHTPWKPNMIQKSCIGKGIPSNMCYYLLIWGINVKFHGCKSNDFTGSWEKNSRRMYFVWWTCHWPWEPKTFIFRSYDPYIEGLKPLFFMLFGVQRDISIQSYNLKWESGGHDGRLIGQKSLQLDTLFGVPGSLPVND